MSPRPGTMAFTDRIIFMANVLTGIGAPRSYGNILTLLGWAAKENTKANNNPLATTAGWILKADGSDPGFFNTITKNDDGSKKSGVRNYDNPITGVEATVATFLQKNKDGEFKYYGTVVELLRKGTTDKEFLANPEAYGHGEVLPPKEILKEMLYVMKMGRLFTQITGDLVLSGVPPRKN